MVALGNVCKIRSATEMTNNDHHWLLNLDMVEQQTGKILGYNYVSEGELNGSIIRFGTANVLYSKLRPNLNKVVVPDRPGYATSEMLPLLPNPEKITREYLATFLRSDSFVTWAVSKTAGAKMPRLGTKELLSKEIPVPSIAEQKEITDRLTAVDTIMMGYKQQLGKLDELVKSRFIELFDGKYQKVFLGDHLQTTSGGTPSKTHPEYYDGGSIPWLTSGEVNQGIISTAKNYITQQGVDNSSAKLLPPNSVVIAMYGATAGQVGLLRIETTTNQAVCAVLPNARFVPEYLYYAIKSNKDWMISQAAGGAQPNISQGVIKKMQIIDAPYSLQNEFAAFVEQTDKLKLAVKQSLDKLETLKKSLMQKYFG